MSAEPVHNPPPPAADDRNAAPQRGVGAALSLGTTMAAGMIVFAALGWWIDKRRGGGAFWTVCGLLLGFATGIYEAWKAIRQLDDAGRRGTPEPEDKS
jgi:ATP synthase protein I